MQYEAPKQLHGLKAVQERRDVWGGGGENIWQQVKSSTFCPLASPPSPPSPPPPPLPTPLHPSLPPSAPPRAGQRLMSQLLRGGETGARQPDIPGELHLSVVCLSFRHLLPLVAAPRWEPPVLQGPCWLTWQTKRETRAHKHTHTHTEEHKGTQEQRVCPQGYHTEHQKQSTPTRK